MTAKEYLSQVLYIDQRINCKLEQVMRLRENATKATATLSDMPHSDSPNLKSMENTICKIVDLEREIVHGARIFHFDTRIFFIFSFGRIERR